MALLEKEPKLCQSSESLSLEVCELETVPAKITVKLPNSHVGIPYRLELRHEPRDFAEVDTVVACIRARLGSIDNAAAGDNVSDYVGQFADTVILAISPHVERLVMNYVPGDDQRGGERPADVFDVHERAPWRAVAHDVNLSRSKPPACQIVKHDISSQTL